MANANALIMQAIAPILPYLTADTFEVMINKPGELWVDSTQGMHKHDTPDLTEQHNLTLLQLLASSRFKTMSVKTPILKESWENPNTGQKWRITGIMPPVTKWVAFNFRRTNIEALTTEALMQGHYFEKEKLPIKEVAAFQQRAGDRVEIKNTCCTDDWQESSVTASNRHKRIVEAINAKRNIVISGATGSSKSQFLNWCLTQIPKTERIITIEDTEELVITQPNHVQLYYPDDSEQSECPVNPEILLRLVLRMKPNRIIMGEVTGTELVTMLEQVNTGHPGTIMTLHTNSTAQARQRMRDIMLKVYPNQKSELLENWIADVVDMIVQVKRQGQHFFIDDIWEKVSG